MLKILVTYIEFNQTSEFIELWQEIQTLQKVNVNNYLPQSVFSTKNSKSTRQTCLLHLACEHKANHIVVYLLFQEQADVNVQDSAGLSCLHIACYQLAPQIIDALLSAPGVNIEITSREHGTPLHAACLVSSVKICQQLLLQDANINAVDAKGKLPRELTTNQRIQFLIDKQDQRVQTQMQTESRPDNQEMQLDMGDDDDSIEGGGEGLDDADFGFRNDDNEETQVDLLAPAKDQTEKRVEDKPAIQVLGEDKRAQLTKIAQPLQGQKSNSLEQQAIQFIQEFEQSKIKIVPNVQGYITCLSVSQSTKQSQQQRRVKGPDLRYLQLQPYHGEMLIYQTQQAFQAENQDKCDKLRFAHLLYVQEPLHSHSEMKSRSLNHCLEMQLLGQSQTIIVLGCFCAEQLQQWLKCIQEAKKFNDWLQAIKVMLDKHEHKQLKYGKAKGLFSDEVEFKLQEIKEYCQEYCLQEKYQIENLTLKQAQAKEQKRQAATPQQDGGGVLKWLKKSILGESSNPEPQPQSVTPVKQVERVTHHEERQPLCFADIKIEALVGEGSFGKVFEVQLPASHNPCKRRYAMKSMPKQKLIKNKQIKYAVSEAQIMSNLKAHPFILTLDYAFQTPENMHLVFEFIENGDLSQQLDHYQFLEEDSAVFVTAQLVLAIEFLHANQVIFRDLKPENILLDARGYIRLADFGLSKQMQGDTDKQQVAQSFCGSPAYLAPEMLAKTGVTESSDVYQVGVVLYEMLVGIPPHYTDNINELYANIQKGKLKVPKYLSKKAQKCLYSLLEHDTKKRPTMSQLKQDKFFEAIDWDKLHSKELTPPEALLKTLPPTKEQEEIRAQEAILSKKGKQIFEDSDYTQKNRSYNRVKNFSFDRYEYA